jgi:AraC family transcriptional regulator of adaptative response/methylated-DNA-[protein]-cysteine methyltransferase
MSQNPSPLATTEARRWQAVATRDATSDGAFVYAVASTGVFCRPSCPSRRPTAPHNVRFFDSAEAAVAAGFRACRRCRPEVPGLADPERRIVEAVCGAIAEAEEAIPTLDELAEAAGVSPHHLQRVFTRARAVAAPLCRGPAARALHRRPAPGRAGDGGALRCRLWLVQPALREADAHLGMTPASYAKGGAGAQIAFSVADSPLGRLLGRQPVAVSAPSAWAMTTGRWRPSCGATSRPPPFGRDDDALAAPLAAVLDHLAGWLPRLDLPIDVRATAFQWQVWRALVAHPARRDPHLRRHRRRAWPSQGGPRRRAGLRPQPGRPRRALPPRGRRRRSLAGYRWGLERKRRLLDLEKTKKGD